MRFLVERASVWRDERPCDEAEELRYVETHEFFLMPGDDPLTRWPDCRLLQVEDIPDHPSGPGYRRAYMEEERSRWVVELEDLPHDLFDFAERYGSLILTRTQSAEDPDDEEDSDGGEAAIADWKLTIYDDYVE